MATPSGIRSAAGIRDFQIFVLDDDGFPSVTTAGVATPTAGIDVSGMKSCTFNLPESRQIVHVGDDRPFLLDSLPPTEPVSGEAQAGKLNDTVNAAVTGQKSYTIADKKMFGFGTSQQGSEPMIAILTYQQAQEADPSSSVFGKRQWNFYLMPKGWMIPRPANEDDNPALQSYTIRPQFSTQHLWGTNFTAATEGFTRAQVLPGVSEGRPAICAWKTTGASTATYLLPTAYPLNSTSETKIALFDCSNTTSEVINQGSYALPNLTSIVLDENAVTSGATMIAFYETSADD